MRRSDVDRWFEGTISGCRRKGASFYVLDIAVGGKSSPANSQQDPDYYENEDTSKIRVSRQGEFLVRLFLERKLELFRLPPINVVLDVAGS